MRIISPGRMRVDVGTNSWCKNQVTTTDGRYGWLLIPEEFELTPLNTSFWCTTGRDQNDVVHSKLVEQPIPEAHNEHAMLTDGVLTNGQHYLGSAEFVGSSLSGYTYRNAWYSLIPNGDTQVVSRTLAYAQGLPTNGRMSKYGSSSRWMTVHFQRTSTERVDNNRYNRYSCIIGAEFWKDGTIRFAKGSYCPSFPGIPGNGDVIGQHGLRLSSVFESPLELARTVFELACKAISPYHQLIGVIFRSESIGKQANQRASLYTMSEVDPISVDGFSRFLFSEPQLIRDRFVVTNPVSGYWFNWLIEHAYLEALDSVPVMSDNNLQNIIELASFIVNLVVHKRIEIPRSLQDAWLAYRYSFSTTKSDVEEAIEFVHRNMDLSCLEKGAYLKCYGMSSTTYEDTDVLCRCRLEIRHKELGMLQDVWYNLYKFGLAPDFYVLWDSLPYSFIVDWFIPLGDMFEVIDASNVYCSESFDIKNVVFSLQYNITDGAFTYHQYSRWAQSPLTRLNSLYWLDKPAASAETTRFRLLDAASLFIR